MTGKNFKEIDIEFVRAQFPAFSEQKLANNAFFENAGGSYMCKQVISRFDRYFKQRKVQPYGLYKASELAGQEMDEARRRMAEYLNINSDEVLFGPSTSQNTYVLAQGFLNNMGNRNKIIVSEQEHEANAGAWHRMKNNGVDVYLWKINPDNGCLDIEDLNKLMDEKVFLVAVTHCSNIIGEINPIKNISKLVHKAGALLIVDGVSYCPHGLPDVSELGADIYLFSTYKTFGPHQGVMVIRNTAKQKLENQSHFFNSESSDKFMVPAGPDHAQIAACNGIIDYFDLIDKHHYPDENNSLQPSNKRKRVSDLFRNSEINNLKPLLDYISDRDDLRLIGPNNNVLRAPTIAFTSASKNPETVVKALANKGIMAGAGDFYAVRPLKALGVNPDIGVVRLSFVHYTSKNEIKAAIKALDAVL